MSEPNVARKGNRLVIPCYDPVFPPVCVVTGRSENVVWVEGDLNALSDPKMQKNLLPFAVVAMAIAGGQSVSDLGSVRAGAGFFAPSVRFAVDEAFYENWKARYLRRKKVIISLVIGGLIILFGAMGVGIAMPNDAWLMNLCLATGAIVAASAGFYSLWGVRPLLHSVKRAGERHVSVRGAKAAFLDQLDPHN